MQNISSRELHKQIQMHLESLRLSGVEWLENNNNSTLQISEGLAHKSPPVDGEAAVTNLPLPEKSSTHSVLHSLEKNRIIAIAQRGGCKLCEMPSTCPNKKEYGFWCW